MPNAIGPGRRGARWADRCARASGEGLAGRPARSGRWEEARRIAGSCAAKEVSVSGRPSVRAALGVSLGRRCASRARRNVKVEKGPKAARAPARPLSIRARNRRRSAVVGPVSCGTRARLRNAAPAGGRFSRRGPGAGRRARRDPNDSEAGRSPDSAASIRRKRRARGDAPARGFTFARQAAPRSRPKAAIAPRARLDPSPF